MTEGRIERGEWGGAVCLHCHVLDFRTRLTGTMSLPFTYLLRIWFVGNDGWKAEWLDDRSRVRETHQWDRLGQLALSGSGDT